MGVLNSALPFTLIAYATLSVSAGYAAILNATSPFFAALVAYAGFGERLGRVRLAGLIVGFGGVVILAGDRASLAAEGAALAVAAALAAAALYGAAANYSRRRLAGVDPVAAAAGSQLAAALALAPAAAFALPPAPPAPAAWAAALALGALSTGLAYALYFRLLESAGPARAIVVTFLIPVFGMLWGALVLGEAVTPHMAFGTLIILAGTAMTAGFAGGARRDR
jgi:drug/metabolite transporter (DMT)-like permease